MWKERQDAREGKRLTWQSLTKRAVAAKILLVVFGLVTLASMASTFAEIQLAERIEAGEVVREAEITANDAREDNLLFLWFVSFIAVAVAFLMWTYRTSQNLVARGVQLRFSSGWAVGCWFVPIIALFRPYQAVKEIWKRSHPNRYDPDSLLVDVWWALWLLSFLVSYVYQAIPSDTPSDLVTANWIDIVVLSPLGLATGYLLFRIIGTTTKNQEAQHTQARALYLKTGEAVPGLDIAETTVANTVS